MAEDTILDLPQAVKPPPPSVLAGAAVKPKMLMKKKQRPSSSSMTSQPDDEPSSTPMPAGAASKPKMMMAKKRRPTSSSSSQSQSQGSNLDAAAGVIHSSSSSNTDNDGDDGEVFEIKKPSQPEGKGNKPISRPAKKPSSKSKDGAGHAVNMKSRVGDGPSLKTAEKTKSGKAPARQEKDQSSKAANQQSPSTSKRRRLTPTKPIAGGKLAKVYARNNAHIFEMELSKKYRENVFWLSDGKAELSKHEGNKEERDSQSDDAEKQKIDQDPFRAGPQGFRLDLAGLQARWCGTKQADDSDGYEMDDDFIDDNELEVEKSPRRTRCEGFFVNPAHIDIREGLKRAESNGDSSGKAVSASLLKKNTKSGPKSKTDKRRRKTKKTESR